MNEHYIQDTIRYGISLNNLGTPFRINVGVAWTGNIIIKNNDGSITIKDPRPFATFGSVKDTKALKGFSDIFVVSPTIVTPDMIGKLVARAGFVEVKTPKGKPTSEQINFIEQMQKLGARAGVARSIEDAIQILKG